MQPHSIKKLLILFTKLKIKNDRIPLVELFSSQVRFSLVVVDIACNGSFKNDLKGTKNSKNKKNKLILYRPPLKEVECHQSYNHSNHHLQVFL